MTSLGHASFLGVAAYISALLTSRYGFSHGPAAIISIAGTTAMAAAFGVIALRASGLGFLMITLALSQVLWGLGLSHVQCDERRQRDRRPDPADAVRHLARQRRVVLLVRAGGRGGFLPDDDDIRVIRVRIVAEGRSRPAAADGGARLQSLDDPLDHLHLCRLLGRRIRTALRLLQQVHSSDIALHHEFGRGPARRHRRRLGDAERPVGRRRAGAAVEELRVSLCRALEHAARARVPVHRSRDADGHRSRL